MDTIARQLEDLRAERRAAVRRGAAYAAGIAPVVAANALGVLSLRAGIVADAAALAAATWWFAIERVARGRRRRLLDDLILHRRSSLAPVEVREREAELLSPRNRRTLARALENQVGGYPVLSAQRLAIVRELRANADRILRVSRRVRTEAVDPRGVVLLEQLIVNGESPIHSGPTSAIAPALERVERALDRAA